MRITMRHHFDFGADRGLVGDDLVRPGAWDALRTQTTGRSRRLVPRASWSAPRMRGPRSATAHARSTSWLEPRTGRQARVVRRRRGRRSRRGCCGSDPRGAAAAHRIRAREPSSGCVLLPRGGGPPARPARRPAARRRRPPLPPGGHRAHGRQWHAALRSVRGTSPCCVVATEVATHDGGCLQELLLRPRSRQALTGRVAPERRRLRGALARTHVRAPLRPARPQAGP